MLPSDDSQWFDIWMSFLPKTRNILLLNGNIHLINKPKKKLRYLGLSPQKLKTPKRYEGQLKVSIALTHISSIVVTIKFITFNEFLSWSHPSLVPPRPVASIRHFIAVHKGIIMPTCPWASMERREVVWEKLSQQGGPK